MAWACLELEIACEMRELSGDVAEETADSLHVRAQRRDERARRLSEEHRGDRIYLAVSRKKYGEYRQQLRTTEVEQMTCPVCGALFTLTAWVKRRGVVPACSDDHRRIAGRKGAIWHEGRVNTVRGWARIHGMNVITLQRRLASGMTFAQAIDVPRRPNGGVDSARFITVEGVRRSLGECVRLYGVKRITIIERLKRGWSEDDAARTPPAEMGRRKQLSTIRAALLAEPQILRTHEGMGASDGHDRG